MRILSLLFAGTLLAGLIASGAAAQPNNLSAQYRNCYIRAGGNIVQEGICGQRELLAQDARLNKSYQQLMRQLASRPQRRLDLRTEQRAWLRRRDYSCKIDDRTIDSTCIVRKTADRADELESQLRF